MLIRYGSAKIIKTAATLAGISSPGHIKRASTALESMALDPERHVYLRNRAVSALEMHGPNQNWDGFEYDELQNCYSSFIGKDVTVDHISTNVIGTILDSEFIPSPEVRASFGLPLLPLDHTINTLCKRCKEKDTWSRVFGYAEQNNLVRGSDQKMIVEAVAKNLANSGWAENIWAVNKEAANDHLYGMPEKILSGKITDSSMGCAPAGTKILLSDLSEIPIEEIQEGMEVLTHKGRPKKVTHIFKRYFDKGLYFIDIRGLSDMACFTYEHPFYVIKKEQVRCEVSAVESKGKTKCYPTGESEEIKNLAYGYRKKACDAIKCERSFELGRFNPEFVTTQNLRVGDYVAYSFSDEVRPTKLSPKFFRLLGYYLAEGCIANCMGKPNRVEFTLNKDEKEYLLEIMSLVEGLYGCTPKIKEHSSSNAISVMANNAEMARDMLKHGNKLAKTKYVSDEILYAPYKHQLELIGSFINGDGFNDKHGGLYLESSSRQLINNMMWMLSRARIVWALQEQYYPVKPHKCGNSIIGTKPLTTWKLRVSNREVGKLGQKTNKFIPGLSMERTRTYSFYFENHLFFPIKSIKFDNQWKGNIYNFEVEEDNSYIANNISVHNCLVNEAVCSVCGNVASGDLPEQEDFCECILRWKGQQMPFQGIYLIPYEINRDVEFFEDTVVLPDELGGQAGGEGADKDAKLLEVYSSKKKKAYMDTSPNPSPAIMTSPEIYVMIGDKPDNVAKNEEEFKSEQKELIQEHIEEESAPGKHPAGTIVTIIFEGEDVDAAVVDEFDDGTLTVAIDGIDEPVEIGIQDIKEVVEYPEEMDYEQRMDVEVPHPEMHPEKRSANKIN